jgi:predicted nucleic acid-binding Zn ribbon protein
VALQSLHHLIHHLESQETLKANQRFQKVLSLWPSVVGDAVAAKTQPLGLQQDVLKVAVYNSVWAQNLAYERQRILDKLHQRSPELGLTDIRFSTTPWHSQKHHSSQSSIDEAEIPDVWRSHPSRINIRTDEPFSRRLSVVPKEPEEAFQKWAERIQRRSQRLPLCPVCQCPTPEGELRRWRVCGLCAAHHWSTPPQH